MSEHDTYIVRSSGKEWAVRLDDETLGMFNGRHEAVQAAVVVAEASGRVRKGADVLFEEEDGEMPPNLGGRTGRIVSSLG